MIYQHDISFERLIYIYWFQLHVCNTARWPPPTTYLALPAEILLSRVWTTEKWLLKLSLYTEFITCNKLYYDEKKKNLLFSPN